MSLKRDARFAAAATAGVGALCYRRAVLADQNAELLLQKLKEVEENAWMMFNELPPSGARTRALHVYLDAKDLQARLGSGPVDQPGDRQ